MRASVSIPLAGLFVFLAAINVWIMLTGRGRHSTRPPDLDTGPSCLRVCLHILVREFLLLHVTAHQVADELSARIILHFSLAFILVPLVLVKVIVVRFQKSAWNTLVTLGITSFAIAFALVSMNVAVHYLRDIVPHKVPFAISPRVIVATIVAGHHLFFCKGQAGEAKDTC